MGMPEPGTQEYADWVYSMRKPGAYYPGSEAAGILPQEGVSGDAAAKPGDSNIDIPNDWYPKSGSQSTSSGSTYSGAAAWAIPAYKEMVGQAPKMASSWGSAWDNNAKVPELIQSERAAVPARTLAGFDDFQNYVNPVRNASAARGMRDSTVGQAGEMDMRKQVYNAYEQARYNSDKELTDQLLQHYSNTLSQAIQSVAAATGMAELGRESRGSQSASSSAFSENQLDKIAKLIDLLNVR